MFCKLGIFSAMSFLLACFQFSGQRCFGSENFNEEIIYITVIQSPYRYVLTFILNSVILFPTTP